MSGTLFFLSVENVQDGSFLYLHIHVSLINSYKAAISTTFNMIFFMMNKFYTPHS